MNEQITVNLNNLTEEENQVEKVVSGNQKKGKFIII